VADAADSAALRRAFRTGRRLRREELLNAAETVDSPGTGTRGCSGPPLHRQGSGRVTKPIIYRHFGDLQDLYRAAGGSVICTGWRNYPACWRGEGRRRDVDHHTMDSCRHDGLLYGDRGASPTSSASWVLATRRPSGAGGRPIVVSYAVFAEQIGRLPGCGGRPTACPPSSGAMGYAAAGSDRWRRASWWLDGRDDPARGGGRCNSPTSMAAGNPNPRPHDTPKVGSGKRTA